MCNPAIIRAALADLHPQRISGHRIQRRPLIGASLLAAAGAASVLVGSPGAASAKGQTTSGNRIIDLTHPLSATFPVYPGYTPFSAEITSTIDGVGSLSRQVTMEEHVGTHVDAPAHFISDGEDVSQIAVNRLIAPLVVIDISDRAANDADTTVTVDDIRAWEADNGTIPGGALVAMNAGWDRRADDPEAFLNADIGGTLHFPAWSPDAARLLVEERDIVALGVDTLSMDNATSPRFETHRILLGAGGYGVENLANLADVPASGAMVIVGAPRYVGGSGGQARVLAIA